MIKNVLCYTYKKQIEVVNCMQSNELKVKSFRVSQEVTEQLGRMIEERQITTNQLFEELIQLADQKSPDPLLNEENAALEAVLQHVTTLFQERATRLEMLRQENERIKSKHRNTVESLETQVTEEQARLEAEYQEKTSIHQLELERLQKSLEGIKSAKERQELSFKEEQTTFKEETKQLKKAFFDLEGQVKKSEDERDQLYRQNQSLIDMMEDFKARARRADQLKEENQKLHLEVQILRREKAAFENRLKEQVELALLRERNK